MPRARHWSFSFLVASSVALSACGGGTTITTARPSPTPSVTSSASLATAQFDITVPAVTSLAAPSAHLRNPQYVSTGTLSVVITLLSVDGAPPPGAVFPSLVVIGGTDCAPGGNGTTCTANVSGFTGADVYSVATYGTANGTGTPLSTGSIPVTLTAGSTTTVAISDTMSTGLAPVAAAIVLSAAPLLLASGVPGTAQISVNETDASGAFILGTAFGSPVTLSAPAGATAYALSVGGGAGAPTLAVTTSSVVTVAYDGTSLVSPATFVASAAGPSSSTLGASINIAIGTPTMTPTMLPTTPATTMPTPGAPVTTPTTAPALPPNNGPGIVANVSAVEVNEVGSTSTFVVQQNGFSGPFNGAIADQRIANATLGSDGATFTVTGLAVGSTTITVTGANGQTLTLPIDVTQSSIIINSRHRP